MSDKSILEQSPTPPTVLQKPQKHTHLGNNNNDNNIFSLEG